MSMAIVDLNADGVNDLAVSAPSVGSQALEYFGQVFVYFGNEHAHKLEPEPSVVINCTVSNTELTIFIIELTLTE